MFKHGITVAAALTSAPAAATDWWYVGYTGSGTKEVVHFIDLSTVNTSYDTRKYWTFIIYETISPTGVRKEKQYWEVNCSDRSSTIISYVEYGNNDRLLKSHIFPSYARNQSPVVPESIGESKLNLVCNGAADGAFQISSQITPEEAAVVVFKD